LRDATVYAHGKQARKLSAAHARKFEIFTEQAKQLTSLAQKVTTDAVQPLQAGVLPRLIVYASFMAIARAALPSVP
jgi:hypothetical protein